MGEVAQRRRGRRQARSHAARPGTSPRTANVPRTAPAEPNTASGTGAVTFAVTGGPASASQTVHQYDAAGGPPGRCSVVWRIQAPRGRSGSTARR